MRRRLFTANEVFQGVLLHVRTLCERASGSKNGSGVGQNAIKMIEFNSSITYTLNDFNTIQQIQIEKSLGQLRQLKEEIKNICYISCVVSSSFNFLAFFLKKINLEKNLNKKDCRRIGRHRVRGLLSSRRLFTRADVHRILFESSSNESLSSKRSNSQFSQSKR